MDLEFDFAQFFPRNYPLNPLCSIKSKSPGEIVVTTDTDTVGNMICVSHLKLRDISFNTINEKIYAEHFSEPFHCNKAKHIVIRSITSNNTVSVSVRRCCVQVCKHDIDSTNLAGLRIS